MRTIGTVLLVAVLLTIPYCVHARTWYIMPDGTGDAATIQAGIDSAAVSDTVLVAAGAYTGAGNKALDFEGKDIVLLGEDGPETTVIDCGESGRGLYFRSGESPSAVVEGFTIENAYTEGPGGAVYILSSSPTIRNCVFNDNSSDWGDGGAIVAIHSSVTITRCSFTGNSTVGYGYGGAVALESSGSPLVADCVFSHNEAAVDGGGIACGHVSVLIVSCTFADNHTVSGYGFGGGAYLEGPATVTNCTFVGNSSTYGAGIYSAYSTVSLENTIVAFNLGDAGIRCMPAELIALVCCDVFGNPDGDWVGCIADQYDINGNISEDPLFCGEVNYPSDPYRLDIASPCAVRNSPCGQLIGARPAGCSGPVPAEPTTWGRVKAMYR